MTQRDRQQVDCYPIAEDVAPSRATYLAVADSRACDPLDLPPLAETITPESLDTFVETSTESGDRTITFEYAGCTVTVSTGEVRVDDPGVS